MQIKNDNFTITLHDDLSVLVQTRWASRRMLLARLEVRDRMQERVETVTKFELLQKEYQGHSIHCTLRDAAHGVTVGLWLTANPDGTFSILVPPAEIEEAQAELYRAEALEVLPGLLWTDDKMLLPVNTGVLCSLAGKPAMRDRFLIYGEQERWELVPTLPVCGTLASQGGFVAVATQGACEMYCAASADGNGSGTVSLYPMLRRHWVDPVDWTNREVRITALAPGVDLVGRAAQVLREHVVRDLGKKTLRQRASESPACAYQQRAYTMKLFHGVQRQGLMIDGRQPDGGLLFQRTLSFADASRNFGRLKDAGIDRIYFQSVGWNPKGHDGAWPTMFPIDQRLGGEAGLRAMIETAKALGFQITTHLNCSCCAFQSPDYRPEYVIHDLWNQPKVTGFWGGGINGKHWGLALPAGYLETRLQALRALGFNGMQYLDGIGNPLYVNYHPVHGGPRRDHAAGINRFLDAASAAFGGVETEMGYLYCALHADAVSTGGCPWHLQACPPAWPITQLFGELVPVWQLTMHGLVTQENKGIGWPDTMRAILFGQVPRDEWASEPGVMPVLDHERIAKLKPRYDLCCVKYGHLITEPIVSWQRSADNVEQTQFADGTVVLADFGEGQLFVNKERVPPHP